MTLFAVLTSPHFCKEKGSQYQPNRIVSKGRESLQAADSKENSQLALNAHQREPVEVINQLS
jgi:hypothetical protein